MAQDFDKTLVLLALRRALQLVTHGWATGHQARTEDGAPVPPEHPLATQWCTFGALRAAGLELFPDEQPNGFLLAETSAKYLGAMLKHLGLDIMPSSAPRTLIEWNDAPTRTNADVVELYESTIAVLERETTAAPTRARAAR